MYFLANNSKRICLIRKKQKRQKNDETSNGRYTNVTCTTV